MTNLNENSRLIYQLDSDDLENVLREIIQSEMKVLKEELKKEPRVLSRTEAADALGYSPNTISAFIKKGLLKNRGMGRKILILESDLMKVPKKRGFKYENLDFI